MLAEGRFGYVATHLGYLSPILPSAHLGQHRTPPHRHVDLDLVVSSVRHDGDIIRFIAIISCHRMAERLHVL